MQLTILYRNDESCLACSASEGGWYHFYHRKMWLMALFNAWLRKKKYKHWYHSWLVTSPMFPLETVEELRDLRQVWNDSLPFPHLQLNNVLLNLWECWISVYSLLATSKQLTIITATMVKLSVCSFFIETPSLQYPGSRFSRWGRSPHRTLSWDPGSHGPPCTVIHLINKSTKQNQQNPRFCFPRLETYLGGLKFKFSPLTSPWVLYNLAGWGWGKD